MGPWGAFARVAAAVVVVPAVFLALAHVPWHPALVPVWGATAAGAATGLLGAAAEGYGHIRLTPAARWLLWSGLAALWLWVGSTHLPGFRLPLWPAAAASAALGLAETALPPDLIRQ